MENTLDFQPIILAAGKGTRMNTSLPKVLVGLNGKPMIQHVLDNLQQYKLKHPPIIVVGHKYELVQSYLGKDFLYAFQEGQLGTGHAVKSGLTKATANNILVLYGDMPFVSAESISRLAKLHLDNNAKFSMFTVAIPNYEDRYSVFNGYGRIVRNHRKIQRIVEFLDATDEQKQITEVNPGIYFFDTKWIRDNIDKLQNINRQKEFLLTDMAQIAADEGLEIFDATIEPWEVYGINTQDQMKQAGSL